MSSFPAFYLADVAAAGSQAGQPLFGNFWLALLAVLGGITLFLAAVAILGRWLAATHPDPLSRVVPPTPPVVVDEISPEIAAVIAATVATLLGSEARIAAVKPEAASTSPSIEMLMQQWSMEGRRQIYSSHKVR